MAVDAGVPFALDRQAVGPDQLVAERAEKAGATVWTGTEAVSPITEDGRVVGAVVRRKDGDGEKGFENPLVGYPVPG